MEITMKSVKFSEALSQETNAFTANLYVDGKKVGYIRNEGHGGETMVQPIDGNSRAKFKEAEEYCKSLPPYTYGDPKIEIPMNLSMYVDDLMEKWLKEKEAKKIAKKMNTRLMWGVPNSNSYKEVNYKRPLASIPKADMQREIDNWKSEFRDGEVFFNTNLGEFNL